MAKKPIVVDASAPAWAHKLAADVASAFEMADLERRGKRLAKADLPRDGSETTAVVTDEASLSAPILAYFDGADWRRVTDGGKVV